MAAEDFDDELLETVIARSDILGALADGPCHRRELQDRFDVSKTTCHRIVRSLDERDLIRRTDRGYELSELGTTIWTQVKTFEGNVRTAYRLQPLYEALESTQIDLEVELFADATITRPLPEDPSPPVHRYLELFRDAETVRTLDRSSFIPPLYVEEIFEVALERDGAGIAIYPLSVVEARYEKYPDVHREVAETGLDIRYRVHDDVPFGMSIYDDDHVGLRAYDGDTGALHLFADTDDPAAVDWAIDVFDRYYEESEPPSAFDELPDWVPESDIQL